MQEPVLLGMNNLFSNLFYIFYIFCFSFISPISIYKFINLIMNLYAVKVSLINLFFHFY